MGIFSSRFYLFLIFFLAFPILAQDPISMGPFEIIGTPRLGSGLQVFITLHPSEQQASQDTWVEPVFYIRNLAPTAKVSGVFIWQEEQTPSQSFRNLAPVGQEGLLQSHVVFRHLDEHWEGRLVSDSHARFVAAMREGKAQSGFGFQLLVNGRPVTFRNADPAKQNPKVLPLDIGQAVRFALCPINLLRP